MNRFQEIYFKYGKRLFILLHKSKGSEYGDAREKLFIQIKERLKAQVHLRGFEVEDEALLDLIAYNLIDSVCRTMEICGTDDKRFVYLAQRIILILTRDLETYCGKRTLKK